MEKFFRKYGWAITLGVIVLMCFLIALNVNAWIASKLAKYTVPSLPSLKSAQANKTKRPIRRSSNPNNMARTIEERCLFGCNEDAKPKTCPDGCAEGEICQEGACVPAPNEGDVVANTGPVASNLAVKLLGVMVAKPNRYSSALLQETSGNQTIILNVGDMLLNEGELIEVHRDRIIIKRNGRLEFIKLENTITAATSKAAAAGGNRTNSKSIYRPPASTGPTNRLSANPPSAGSSKLGAGVKEISKNNYQIQRNVLNQALKDPKKLSTGATLVPNFKNGKRNGIKLLSVSPNSVYNNLGLKRGDIVTRINGTSIRSQAHALEMLQGFKNKSNMYIEVDRSGRREKLKYSVK